MFVNIELKKNSLFAECPDIVVAEFPALPSARARALGKDFFLKKIFAECRSDRALGKEITKKK